MSRHLPGRACASRELVRALWVLALLLTAAPVFAQSSITGQVADESGAVLPGATIEAASPVLIEKVRSAVADGQGRYTITNLRPGDYVVTVSLPGFATVRREGLTVPDNFTATVNAVLKLGSVEETVTVTGASPVVDVQRVQTTQVVNRELLDVIPSGRSYRSVATLVTAVRAHKQSVGDSGPLAQNLQVHGMGSQNSIVLFDGLNTSSFIVGQAGYANDAAVQEISYQTSANSADVSVGGLRVNMVPKDGGNSMHGGGFFADLEGKWQSDNMTDELRARGLQIVNSTRYSRDINPWMSGPLMQDRLWWLGSYRRTSNSQTTAGAFFQDGSPGINQISLTNLTGRVTAQVSAKNKISVHVDRVFRNNPYFVNPGQIVEESSTLFDPDRGKYVTGQLRWTSAISRRVLFEAGYGVAVYTFNQMGRPEAVKTRGTPEWFASAPRVDTALGTTRIAPSLNESRQQPDRKHIMTALSFVTGSHNTKFGVDQMWGSYITAQDRNADLAQVYANGVPSFVDVSPTPNWIKNSVKSEFGFYALDTWQLNRLTLNMGLRFDYFNTYIPEQGQPAGRFVPARFVPETPCRPCFGLSPAPRLGAVYDLFGNGKTAIKGGVNKYMDGVLLTLTQQYNPLNQPVDRRTWRDTNGDNIAQDGEIGPSNNRNFLTGTPSRRPSPDLERPFVWEYTAGVQQEVIPGFALSFAWDLRQFRNIIKTTNVLITPEDFTAFQITNPLDGTPLTVFRLNNDKQGLVDQVDTTRTNSDLTRRTYQSFELNFNARLPFGATAFGGMILERNVAVDCEVENPNALRFCDQTGELFQEYGAVPDIAYTKGFKLSGLQPLPYGVMLGVAFQSIGGCGANTTTAAIDCHALRSWLPVSYPVPSALFPGGATLPVTVDLATPTSRTLPRWNQFDVNVQKNFRVGNRVDLQARLEIFNLTNSSPVLQEITAFGPALGRPTEILVGRVPRIGLQVKF